MSHTHAPPAEGNDTTEDNNSTLTTSTPTASSITTEPPSVATTTVHMPTDTDTATVNAIVTAQPSTENTTTQTTTKASTQSTTESDQQQEQELYTFVHIIISASIPGIIALALFCILIVLVCIIGRKRSRRRLVAEKDNSNDCEATSTQSAEIGPKPIAILSNTSSVSVDPQWYCNSGDHSEHLEPRPRRVRSCGCDLATHCTCRHSIPGPIYYNVKISPPRCDRNSHSASSAQLQCTCPSAPPRSVIVPMRSPRHPSPRRASRCNSIPSTRSSRLYPPVHHSGCSQSRV